MTLMSGKLFLAAAGAAIAALVASTDSGTAAPIASHAGVLATPTGGEAFVHQVRRRWGFRRYRSRGRYNEANRESPNSNVGGGPQEYRQASPPTPLVPIQRVEPCTQLLSTGVSCSKSF
jgi:hypothetical protein